jgi:death on curing protein
MDASRRHVIQYPTVRQIIRINQIQIDLKGGMFVPPFNLREEGGLALILDSISEPIYGTEPFPSIYNKAAALTWKIIVGHVFYDGNKRTAMLAGMALMHINHKPLRVTQEQIVNTAMQVAESYKNGYTTNDLSAWFFQHSS